MFAVAAGITALVGGGSDDDATPPERTDVVATVPVATEPDETVPSDTVPSDTVPSETVPSDTEPVENPFDEIGVLLVWTSFDAEPLDELEQQAEIDALVADRTVEAVAHPTRVSTLCAGIPVDVPLELTITWQYAGETIRSDPRSATPPGTGACLTNDGAPLSAGTYQVLATDATEDEVGFATTFVVGATEVLQQFENNTDVDICDIGVAPLDTAFYEVYGSEGGPLGPGELVNIVVASVEQDLRSTECDGENFDSRTFFPNATSTEPLVP